MTTSTTIYLLRLRFRISTLTILSLVIVLFALRCRKYLLNYSKEPNGYMRILVIGDWWDYSPRLVVWLLLITFPHATDSERIRCIWAKVRSPTDQTPNLTRYVVLNPVRVGMPAAQLIEPKVNESLHKRHLIPCLMIA